MKKEVKFAIRALTLFLALLSTVLLTACVFLWFAAGEIYDYQDTFELGSTEPVDVVLCLAGGKHRIPLAVELWQKLKIQQLAHPPILFLSGVGPHASLLTLIEQGVPYEIVNTIKKEEVVFENVSENTFENAQIFSSYVRQSHWKSVVLVTADYHMRRAEFIIRKTLDPEVEIFSATVGAMRFGRNDWHSDWHNNAYAIRVTLIEYVKWLYYRYHYND